jgi:hypothetical protein
MFVNQQKLWYIEAIPARADHEPIQKTSEVMDIDIRRGRIEIVLHPWQHPFWFRCSRFVLRCWMMASIPFIIGTGLNYAYLASM